MAQVIPEAVRFRVMWRGREAGTVLPVTVDDRRDGLSFGMADTLVQRQICEWCEAKAEAKAAQPPVAAANHRRKG